MSAQGWAAVALGVVAVGLTGTAMVLVVRQLLAAFARPAVLAAMTLAQRRAAMRQVRKDQMVTGQALPAVRAVAVELAGQRALALLFVGLAVLFAAQALFPLHPAVLRVVNAVVAVPQVLVAALFASNARRARRWLAAHPDPAGVGAGR